MGGQGRFFGASAGPRATEVPVVGSAKLRPPRCREVCCRNPIDRSLDRNDDRSSGVHWAILWRSWTQNIGQSAKPEAASGLRQPVS